MFDGIVIGGGLAGCSAAITLAQGGYNVALIEAGTYPRAKVCGEFLSPESLALFKQLDFLNGLNRLNPAKINTLRITAQDSHEWCGKFPAPALSLSRYVLDEALIRHALSYGVHVFTETHVSNIVGSFKDGFEVTAQSSEGRMTLAGRSVIAAHGKRSNLDRVLDRQFPRDGISFVGLKQHFQGDRLFEHIDLHTFPGGYCGISQVEDDRTNVCMLVKASVFKAVSRGQENSVEYFMNWICKNNREFDKWMTSATPLYSTWLTIGQVSLVPKPPVDHDILFAGDASGMVAPLAGDGMAMALHSGMIAANTLHRYLSGQIHSSMTTQSYQKVWHSTFRSRLRLGQILQSIILQQSILKHGLRLMRAFPALGNWMISNTRNMKLLE